MDIVPFEGSQLREYYPTCCIEQKRIRTLPLENETSRLEVDLTNGCNWQTGINVLDLESVGSPISPKYYH